MEHEALHGITESDASAATTESEASQASPEIENPYANRTKKALKEGIADVKAQISTLENEIAEEREKKRLKQKADLQAGIDKLKVQLQELGAEMQDPPTKKRKKTTKKGGRPADSRKGQKGKKRKANEIED